MKDKDLIYCAFIQQFQLKGYDIIKQRYDDGKFIMKKLYIKELKDI